MFGTNDDEVLTDQAGLREALRRDFSMMDHINFGAYRNQHIKVCKKLASVIVELPISYESEGQRTMTPFRYALTLAREDDHSKAGLIRFSGKGAHEQNTPLQAVGKPTDTSNI
ncbi:MAG: hypothetical protein M0022_03895 [Desulfobacteraceae bacterium]|nr:hypothetical protein [Desulfobacteraceae bacterium]